MMGNQVQVRFLYSMISMFSRCNSKNENPVTYFRTKILNEKNKQKFFSQRHTVLLLAYGQLQRCSFIVQQLSATITSTLIHLKSQDNLQKKTINGISTPFRRPPKK
jgi:hypothetical protein